MTPLPLGEGGGEGKKMAARDVNPRICDTTLRDGSHAMAHQFTPEQVRAVVGGLAAAGVPVIEVSHGDGLGGSSFQYGFSKVPEEQLLAAAADAIGDKKLAVLHLPGIGTKEELKLAASYGAKVARICTHVTEADICEQHIRLSKQLGMEVVGFLMLAHMVPPEKIVEQGKLMESYGADCVYVVDSAGAMTIDDARARVALLKARLSCQVGLHAQLLGQADVLLGDVGLGAVGGDAGHVDADLGHFVEVLGHADPR